MMERDRMVRAGRTAGGVSLPVDCLPRVGVKALGCILGICFCDGASNSSSLD